MKKYTKTKYKSYHPKYLTLIIAIMNCVKYPTTQLTCYNTNEIVSKLEKTFFVWLGWKSKTCFQVSVWNIVQWHLYPIIQWWMNTKKNYKEITRCDVPLPTKLDENFFKVCNIFAEFLLTIFFYVHTFLCFFVVFIRTFQTTLRL